MEVSPASYHQTLQVVAHHVNWHVAAQQILQEVLYYAADVHALSLLNRLNGYHCLYFLLEIGAD